ncbi:MAG TPA: amino acid permease [Anaerolineales bacterium]|nr:amino acid permease [Anaerolineales bacterium]
MIIPILLLLIFFAISYKFAPRESQKDANVHGAGQVGLLAAVALFGVDYFTSYYYATGELMHALHAYTFNGVSMANYAYYAVVVIILANIIFGGLYMYALGVFSDGGGAFTASIRYLGPAVSLVVAVVLLQDYIFTIVVSTLSGADQLLSITNSMDSGWIYHFLIGVVLVAITWAITIRGRGESASIVFTSLGIFLFLTITLAIGLFVVKDNNLYQVVHTESPKAVTLGEAFYHLLVASMKGLVALTGLEAISNGLQFVIEEDYPFITWAKKKMPKLHGIWNFYSGKVGIGRTVQTSFILYGAVTTLFLAYFSIYFNVYDGFSGKSLVGNLAYIGFVISGIPSGTILYWAYQLLAVVLLSFASMTAYQDIQAMTWRNVAIGEIPETVVYRNPKGTFTRPVTAAAIAAIIVQLLVGGETTKAVPYYGVGVFLPITAMSLAMGIHVRQSLKGKARFWGQIGTSISTILALTIFIGQIVSKWNEGGWVVLISLTVLIILANLLLISPFGHRTPVDIHRIIREKSRIDGRMGSIVEWQSIKFQEYRYILLVRVAQLFEMFGVRRPVQFEKPASPGSFEEIFVADEHSFLKSYLGDEFDELRLGGHAHEIKPEE